MKTINKQKTPRHTKTQQTIEQQTHVTTLIHTDNSRQIWKNTKRETYRTTINNKNK